jgi:hypothetical protein
VKLNPKTPRPKVGELVAEAPAPKRSRREEGTAHAAGADAAEMADGSTKVAARRDETSDTGTGDADQAASNNDSFTGEVNANANSVVRVRVCDETYELASPNCPSTRLLEFMSGMQPRQMCHIHGAQARHARASKPKPKRPAEPQPEPAEAPR